MTTPAPAGVTTKHHGDTLVVSIRRRSVDTVLIFLSTLFLLAIPLPIAEQAPTVAAVLALPFFALAYAALTSVVNHNTVTLGSLLETSSGPLPWVGADPLETARITSIEARAQRVNRNRSSYDIVALIDGVPHVVVSRLRVAERAHFAASALNAHLATLRATPAVESSPMRDTTAKLEIGTGPRRYEGHDAVPHIVVQLGELRVVVDVSGRGFYAGSTSEYTDEQVYQTRAALFAVAEGWRLVVAGAHGNPYGSSPDGGERVVFASVDGREWVPVSEPMPAGKPVAEAWDGYPVPGSDLRGP